MITSFWTRLLDAISPRLCPVCGGRLTPNESVICLACHLELPKTRLSQNPIDNDLARLFWGHFPVEKAAAWFYYEPKTSICQIVIDMKYHNRPDTARNLGSMMARDLSANNFFDGIDAIVPMPITKQRRKQRGYNQSEELAKGVSDVSKLTIITNAVERSTFTTSQTQLTHYERRKNVEGAFHLTGGEKLAGKHLLLVDDVITTGATVTACAKELAKAEGVRISILALALTRTDRNG